VVYRFDIGGLENGLVTLLNRMPEAEWRHTVVALTTANEAFCRRVRRPDVRYVALEKGEGHLHRHYGRLVRLFRELRPDIVHTRNLAALEATVPAWLAGVPRRVHGEHGRDARDPDGRNRRMRWVRRAYSPFVSHYVALSRELAAYLTDAVGISPGRVTRICNGVDTLVFRPKGPTHRPPAGWPFDPRCWVIGTVGRLDPVKGTEVLVQAFGEAVRRQPQARSHLRLVIVGDGPERPAIERALAEQGVADLAWLPGSRSDIPELMGAMDCFVLPSLGEGISNTILEAMACGLPVVATRVGGNAELVSEGVTGELVEPQSAAALADAMVRLADDRPLALRYGEAGRARAVREFSVNAMVDSYARLYKELLGTGAGAEHRSVADAPQGARR
jgi:sugar transferase (PEP-CTERM/EpsH1 system associated)